MKMGSLFLKQDEEFQDSNNQSVNQAPVSLMFGILCCCSGGWS
jgi:hypothetical protein